MEELRKLEELHKLQEYEKLQGMAREAPDEGGLPGRAEHDPDSVFELARKAGKGQQEYLEVKMEEVMVSSAAEQPSGDEAGHHGDLAGLHMADHLDAASAGDHELVSSTLVDLDAGTDHAMLAADMDTDVDLPDMDDLDGDGLDDLDL